MTEFETFLKPNDFLVANMTLREPMVINGMALVKKYRVVIEEVPESDEDVKDRILTIWNSMEGEGFPQIDIDAIKDAAAEYGLDLE